MWIEHYADALTNWHPFFGFVLFGLTCFAVVFSILYLPRVLYRAVREKFHDYDSNIVTKLLLIIPYIVLGIIVFIYNLLLGWAVYEQLKDTRDWWHKGRK